MTTPSIRNNAATAQADRDEELARRLQAEHRAWLKSPEHERQQREHDEHVARWRASRPDPDAPIPQAEDQPRTQIGRDRRDFLAALDHNAPDILKSLKWMPVRWAHDDASVREYVQRWVKSWPTLASMDWFVRLAEDQVQHEERATWFVRAEPWVAYDTAIPRPDEALLCKLSWDPFSEPEESYRERARQEIENHIVRVKGWQAANGYPEQPLVRRRRGSRKREENNVPLEKRWAVLVKKEVLGETYERIIESLGPWKNGGPAVASLRELVQRQAPRIRMQLFRPTTAASELVAVLDPYTEKPTACVTVARASARRRRS